jgi:preprotein translocase subunit SecY
MAASLAAMAGARDVLKKLLFTAAVLAVFRLGSAVPVPGVNDTVVRQAFSSGEIFGFLNLFSGGAFFAFSVFALGIMPYINASIIFQVLTPVIPRLEELSKEGSEGQKKIAEWTRYATVGLAVLQATGLVFVALARIAPGGGAFTVPGVEEKILAVLTLTAGATFLMWLGELINENGVGNGISLIIFAGIIARLPEGIINLVKLVLVGSLGPVPAVVVFIGAIAIVAFVVFMQEGERRVPVQYPKRVVGRRVYGGQTSYIPMKVNAAGVIPVIFAISILTLPLTVASYWNTPFMKSVATFLQFGSWANLVLQFLLVLAFTFYYAAVVFKPDDVADNLRKQGGFIPGFRPGRPTAQYLERVSLHLTTVGAVFLAFITVLPLGVVSLTHLQNLYFGGTSLLIVVGVGLDTLKQVQAQLLMRQYSGFLRT